MKNQNTDKTILAETLDNVSERYIEKILLGKSYLEAPIITSRICGLSSVSNSLTACKAIENATNISVGNQTKLLRELLLAAEIIKNHTNLLHQIILPRFIGADDFTALEKDHPQIFDNALALNDFACDILKAVGGRATHPITVVPGGFLAFPHVDTLKQIAENQSEISAIAEKTIKLFAGFHYPQQKIKSNFMALHSKGSYSLYDGDIWISNGIDFPASELKNNILLEHLPDAGAKAVFIKGHYTVSGPLSRILINRTFPAQTASVLSDLSFKFTFQNPFEAIVAMAAETHLFVMQSFEIISALIAKGIEIEPPKPAKNFGGGTAACESAEGIIIHYYELGSAGQILKAEIITPSNINFRHLQKAIAELDKEKTLDLAEKNNLIHLLLASHGFCPACAKH